MNNATAMAMFHFYGGVQLLVQQLGRDDALQRLDFARAWIEGIQNNGSLPPCRALALGEQVVG